jgi:XTP/dITP diphosphohydrolase
MIPPRLVLATANRGKARELRELVAEWGAVEVLSLEDFPGLTCPDEGEVSYDENAVVKAQAVAAATGLPALGDDSGLEVAALGGAPGIRSARFGATDEERVTKLLRALDAAVGEGRRASFRSVVALAWPDGRVETGAGESCGRIAAAPAGAGGFGYDPIFVPDELDRSFAAASAAEKRAVSHRARAMRALGARLRRA